LLTHLPYNALFPVWPTGHACCPTASTCGPRSGATADPQQAHCTASRTLPFSVDVGSLGSRVTGFGGCDNWHVRIGALSSCRPSGTQLLPEGISCAARSLPRQQSNHTVCYECSTDMARERGFGATVDGNERATSTCCRLTEPSPAHSRRDRIADTAGNAHPDSVASAFRRHCSKPEQRSQSCRPESRHPEDSEEPFGRRYRSAPFRPSITVRLRPRYLTTQF
jgi:hypothetical protein